MYLEHWNAKLCQTAILSFSPMVADDMPSTQAVISQIKDRIHNLKRLSLMLYYLRYPL